ncbi:hypothetical protein CcaverHIS002_0508160 [Cutaneotrichosporon cavernicola]|uniref:Cytochrome c oxidase assembly protein n=1 Tax=Cutaneotrichosporon cavernicola TaxID=279322 RepID=A0AA48L715_9TREE|nr:uncharacterized protein CcaverHIS019_0508740 [Cutaneotrichosporon cavernicola]BEI85415.1 hypothetical protein CcaverHIS002_0508160 [Cutaneotrichosporon cavernicola]BEI93246.1 hypothetical protein CcaverHIS019_0508740 [Cutaneotrichosporon cavernicola]BEJ01023.1 hypothetical protein CcaverHIS631_0508800 [Cutaneotrichosporon cavernicola]BEJ08790.1 hypothetical protein CcaverHIS641_0508840 [Cutaneotrichosporon cavernicola]
MSRASKVFFASAVGFMGATIYGVHWLQQRESEQMYQGVIRDEERVREKALKRVQQPAAVVDDDCVTCVISPPPQLLEAQTAEQRAKERQGRLAEYEAQKGLARRLSMERDSPAVPAPVASERLV